MVSLTVVLSVIQIFAFLSYNEALRVGNSSLVGTISGSFTAVVVILSLLFLGESLSMPSIIAIVVIFAGLFLSSVNLADIKEKTVMNKGTMLSLVAMVGWGLYFTFIKLPVQESGFFWPSYITTVVGTVCLFVFGMNKIKKPKLGLKSGFPAVFLSGVLLTAGSFAFNLAIESGLSSIVAPIAGAYPALFALLAYFIFKDPITKQQRLGILITLLGIIALAYIGG